MKKWIQVYLLIAFAVLGIAVCIHTDKAQTQTSGTEIIVPGTVVDYEVRSPSDEDDSTTYAEVISFELNGQTHRFTRGTSFGWKPKIGRVREIVVDPARPSSARVRMWTWVEKVRSWVSRLYVSLRIFPPCHPVARARYLLRNPPR